MAVAIPNLYPSYGSGVNGRVDPSLLAAQPQSAEALDQANIRQILSPNFGVSETVNNAAENAVAGGFGGSGFAQGQQLRLLDSEKLKHFQIGHELLEPYNQRAFQAGQNAQEQQARLNQIAATGAQALQQLQLQEAGQTSRATASERAAMERQIEAGRQAMVQLQLQEAGQNSRQQATIAGNLANTRLGIGGDLLKAGLAQKPTSMQGLYPPTEFNWATGVSSAGRPSPSQTSNFGGDMGTVDSILAKYGLLN